jgi:hypothetical protein
MPGIDDAAREELRLTLAVVPRWKLSADGWDRIAQLLIDIRRSIAADDAPTFYRHLRSIDEAAPTRLARLEPDNEAESSRGGLTRPPEPLIELVNSLVHAPAGEQGSFG